MAITIDCDSHFLPKDLFDDVDPQFGDRRPRLWFDAAGRDAITYPDREAALSKLSYHQRYGLMNSFIFHHHPPGFWEPEPRIEFLDRYGIRMQVLVPAPTPYYYDVEPDLATSVCQSYNNAISRVLRKYPGRFIGLAQLPMQSPFRALQELDRAITELDLQAAMLFTNINGRNLDEPEFWPIYGRMEELGVPVVLHPSRAGHLLGIERLTKFHLDNSLGFLYEGSLAITSFICSGILDLFPRLRIGLLETGCGYLPYLMDRLNEVYDQEGVNKLIKKRPHEYLDQFWLAANVSAEKETLVYLVQRYGADRLMMAVDFPHGLGGAGEGVIDAVLNNPGLTHQQKERIMGLNAAELFGIAGT